MTSKGTTRQLRPRKKQKTDIYKATVPQCRKLRRQTRGRNTKSVGGKSRRIGPFLRELRHEIIYQEIIVRGRRKLQDIMLGGAQQMTLNYEGQKVTAQVKGPTELEGVGKMFFVFIPSLPMGRFYVHEEGLQKMTKDVDASSDIRI
ncbi:hypothetical protein BGZ60DRAFT_404930 [Tricladium varicosporioides]|nr:hypothetical protein BGZ60DRAFT_404930 [Hymenoscyphus varicosporioides]